MDIALTVLCSHAGLIMSRQDEAPPGQAEHFYGALDRVRAEIAAIEPDVIVILGTDHMKAWTLAGGVPPFAVGLGDTARGLGDAGIDTRDFRMDVRRNAAFLTTFIDQGGCLAFCEEVGIDHSFVLPLMLLDPDGRVPILPLTQNCNVPPRPTFASSYDFGVRIRAALGAQSGRAVLIATGGLSHWVGDDARRAFMNRTPGTRLRDLAQYPVVLDETGPINESFDKAFLDAVRDGRVMDFMTGWTGDRLEGEAGNGAHELRNWIAACAASRDAPAEVLCYEPVAEWLTGVAVARIGPPDEEAPMSRSFRSRDETD